MGESLIGSSRCWICRGDDCSSGGGAVLQLLRRALDRVCVWTSPFPFTLHLGKS